MLSHLSRLRLSRPRPSRPRPSGRLRLLVLGVLVGTASTTALLVTAPTALADPWEPCSPHSLEDKTVRVFPRTPTTPGPSGSASELQCGDRYSGYQRLAAEWAGVPDWQAAADAAISQVLTSGVQPVYDERSDTWTYSAAGITVQTGSKGLILDAHRGS